MYPGSEFNSQGVALVNSSGQSFQPTNGGELMSNDSSQTPAISSNTRPTVIKFFDSAEEFRKFKYVAISELMIRTICSFSSSSSMDCHLVAMGTSSKCKDPKSDAGSSITTVRTNHAGKVEAERVTLKKNVKCASLTNLADLADFRYSAGLHAY
uniref:Uncharacterized protein n=1 Tax=Glossina palpalis gambiensis TaxID=67801 RepID=A0A1B0B8Q3_9MUSC